MSEKPQATTTSRKRAASKYVAFYKEPSNENQSSDQGYTEITTATTRKKLRENLTSMPELGKARIVVMRFAEEFDIEPVTQMKITFAK